MKKTIAELLSTPLARRAVSRELGIHRATVKRWTKQFNPQVSTEERIRALLENQDQPAPKLAVNDEVIHNLLGKGRVTEVGGGTKTGYCRCVFDNGKWGWILSKCLKKGEAMMSEKNTSGRFDVSKLTDEELFDLLREQVNISRFNGLHDRIKTRQIAEEAAKRGWNLKNNHDTRNRL